MNSNKITITKMSKVIQGISRPIKNQHKRVNNNKIKLYHKIRNNRMQSYLKNKKQKKINKIQSKTKLNKNRISRNKKEKMK